jgi:hypothetical protein
MLLEATVIPLSTLPTAHPSAESLPSTSVAPRFTRATAAAPASPRHS